MSKIGPNLNNKALFAGKPNQAQAKTFNETINEARVSQIQRGRRNQRVTFELETPELTANKINPFSQPGMRPLGNA